MLSATYRMQAALRSRAALGLLSLALLAAGVSYLVYADLTQPLTVSAVYPLSPPTVSGAQVSGSVEQQVFRLGSSAPEGPIFSGINPKTGTTCASGGTTCFLYGDQSTINANDFVYLFQVTGGLDSTRQLGSIRVGLCEQATITSVGFIGNTSPFTPSSSLQPPSTPNSEVTFIFSGTQTIPGGAKSALLFFTSPDPPGLHPTSVAGGGASSQAPQAIYGPCPTSLVLNKKIGLAPNGPFSDGPLSVIDGTPVYYQISLSNTGSTLLTGITVSDPQLKAGGDLTPDFFATLPGQLAPGATITKVFGPFQATSGVPVPGVSVNGVNTASAAAEYPIPAQDGSATIHIFPAASADSVTLNVTPQADLSIIKTSSPDPVLVGKELTYTITVTNHGPSPAIGVTLTDTLPEGVTVISAPCAPVSGVLTCNLGDLPKDASITVTIVVRTETPGTITNTAQVTSNTPDPNPNNDAVSHDTTVAPVADLALTKTHSGDFTIGTTGTYTLLVSNAAGAGPTTGSVTVTDTLPGNLTLAGFSGAGWNCAGIGTTNVSCVNSGALAAGASLPVLTLTVNVGLGTPTGTNSVTNTASVATPDELQTANNSASDPTTVNKATPILAWDDPADITYGTALSGTQLNATAWFNGASVAGTFTYTPSIGTLLNAGNNQPLSVSFTPNDTTNFNGATASVQINVLKATPTINWNNPAPIVYGTALSGTQLNATASFNGASVPGAFAYTPSTGTVLNAGNNQPLSVSFTPNDTTNFNGATASVQINVLKATPTINWNNPAPIVYGTALSGTQLNATASFNGASVPGAFAYTPSTGTLLNAGNNQPLSVSFTPNDTTNFNGATASVQINVLKATPTINWNNPAPIVYGTALSGTQLNATASFNGASVPGAFAYTPSTGTLLNAGNNQPLSVSFTPNDTTNFNGATASVQINVLKATPTINWSNPGNIIYGTPLGNAQLNATAWFNGASVPGAFAYTPSTGTVLNAGNNQPLSVSFTPTNSANFNGATASVQINVLKATPTINWSNPAPIVYGTPLGNTQLNATASFNGANVAGTFTYAPPAGTMLNAGNNQLLAVSFAPADAANFNSAAASVQINVLKATPTIQWSNPADIMHGTPLSDTQLNATAWFNGHPMPGAFTYTPPDGTILSAGLGQALATTFVPSDTANFNNAAGSARINVVGGARITVRATVNTTDSCIGAGTTLTIISTLSNGDGLSPQFDNPGPEFQAQIPSQTTLVAGSCTAISGTCTTGSSQIEWNGAVGVGQTVTITYKVKVNPGVLPGASLCFISQARFDSNADGVNDDISSATECATADCGYNPCADPNCAQVGPGQLSPAGSVLVYNLYSSHATNPAVENTRISITNTDPTRMAYLHLFFVDGRSCSVADAFMCLTGNQTATFLASDIDPGVTGYLVAVAVDKDTGCPVSFNFLIGDAYVKLATGHAANLTAESFPALYSDVLADCDVTSATATLAFDGVSYRQAPRMLALNNLPSPEDGNQTMLVLNRFGGDLTSRASNLGAIFGVLYDDVEAPFSFTFTGGCQLRQIFSNSFPRTAPRLSSVIPSGRTGWMKFATDEDTGLLGAVINYNPNTATLPAAFDQGHNLHKLTLTTAASLTIPVIPPFC